MVLTGPDFVGCSSVLQGLKRLGHQTRQLARKLPPAVRGIFEASYFNALVAAWHALPTDGPALVLEDSLWAYLTRMAALIAPDHRATLRNSLIALRLPMLTFVLHMSGWQVGL